MCSKFCDNEEKKQIKIEWERLKFSDSTTAPSPRSGHVSAFINNQMIIFGGHCEHKLNDQIIFIVNIDVDNINKNEALEVTPISSLEKITSTYRVGHAGVILSDNCLYLFGGWNDEMYTNHALRFQPNSLKLEIEQKARDHENRPPPARRDHTLVKMNGINRSHLLLFGGWSHSLCGDEGNELWYRDYRSDLLGSNSKWQCITNVVGTPPCARRGHTASVIGYNMYIFGGLYGFTKYLNDIHVYNINDNQWKQIQVNNPNNKPQKRAWHTAAVINNETQILIFGGSGGRTAFYNDIWIFDIIQAYWFQLKVQCDTSPFIQPRCSHSMIKIYEKKTHLKFLIFGGLISIQNEKESESKNDCDEKAALSPNKKDNNKPKKRKYVKQKRRKKNKRRNRKKSKIKSKNRNNTMNTADATDIEYQNENQDEDNKQFQNSDNKKEEEDCTSSVNTIQLSDDLFLLTLTM